VPPWTTRDQEKYNLPCATPLRESRDSLETFCDVIIVKEATKGHLPDTETDFTQRGVGDDTFAEACESTRL